MSVRRLWHWLTMGPYRFARMKGWQRARKSNSPSSNPPARTMMAAPRAGRRRGPPRHAFASSMLVRALGHDAGFANRWTGSPRRHCRLGIPRRGRAGPFCSTRGAPARQRTLWTESTAIDRKRYWLAEKWKSHLVRQFDGALAAGSLHARYLTSLGMAGERIAITGGCVDNDFFSSRSTGISARPYFLFVGRFVPQKNLPMLLEAYRRYRRNQLNPWELVLVGSGLSNRTSGLAPESDSRD